MKGVSLLCLPTQPLGHCVNCQGSSYTKNEYNLFYQKLDIKPFFIGQFFRKKVVFSEKTVKNCRRIWQFFREKRHLAPKININFLSQIKIWIFYLQKKSYIFWENSKNPFLGSKSLLEERECLARKMNNFF